MKRTPRLLWIIAGVLLCAGVLKATLPQTAIGTWTSAASLWQARSNASAVMLSDDRILITGGDGTGGPLQSAEIFATDGTATFAAAMNVARSRHFAVTLPDGRVLAGGGVSSGGGAINSAELYDPNADSWTQINPMTSARANATAVLLPDGRVLIAGGDNSGSPSNTIEVYDPSTNTFNFAGVLSSPRTKHAMAVLSDGRVLIIGGSDGTNPLASSDIFDPSSGNTSAGPSLATARYGHSATTLLDGAVLVAGGTTTGSNGMVELTSAEIFDAASGTFSALSASLVTARHGHQALLLPNNNNVLIFGGTSGGISDGQPVGTSELFSPWQGTFAATGANLTARSAAIGSAMKQDGLLLTAGGIDASGNALASSELYAFPTLKTDQADYAPGSIVTITGSGWHAGETVTLSLVESPLIDTHPSLTAVADGNGNISNSQFSPDVHDINVRFYLTAVGSQSGLQAQNTFTDGNATSVSGTVRSSVSGNPAIAGATVTCTSGCNNIPAATTTSGTGGAYAFNNATTKLSFATNGPVTLTLTASAPGFNSAALSFTVNNGDTLTGKDFALTPSVSATTTTVATSGTPSTYGTSVTFTATVTRSSGINTPGGTVAIKDGSTTICTTGNLSGSSGTATASCPVSTLSVTGSPHSITAVYGGNINFTGSTSSPISQAVNPKALSVTGITANNKPYDGTTTATLSAGSAVLQGVISGDTVSLDISSYTATFASKNVANSIAVNVTGLGLTGPQAGNYTLTQPTTAANITAVALTASIVTNPTKPYDGNTNATLSSANFALSGLIAGESFTITKNSGTYNSKDVATATTVTASLSASDFTAASGTLASNYTFPTAASGPGQITPKALTASIIGNPTKGYDQTTAATLIPSNFSLSGLIAGESFTVTKNSGTYNSKDVATATTVTASLSASDFTAAAGTLASNYTLPTAASGPGKITPRPLTVSAHGVDKQYDNTTAATVTLSDDRVAGDVFTDSNTGASFADKNVGVGKSVSVSGLSTSGTDASNYALQNTAATTTANITPRPLTVSATGVNKVYDGATTAAVNLTDDRFASDIFTDSYISAMFSDKNVGVGKTVTINGLSISGTDAGNYTLSNTAASTTADITARPLTITATGVNRIYDGTAAATVTLADNRVAGNVFTHSYASASFGDKNVGTGKIVSVTGINISGADAANYTFNSTASTTADITARPLTVTATGVNKVYDGNLAATVTLSDNRISGDTLTDNHTNAVFADKNVGNGKPVSVNGISISGVDAGNYALQNTTANAVADIMPRPLTVSAAGVNKVYDGTTGASVTLSDDRIAGDLLTDSYTSASFTDKNVGNGKAVIVNGISISGAESGNYALQNTSANTTADINARTLTITATGVNKIYDGTTAATVNLSDNRVPGDVFIDTYVSATFIDRNVGTGKVVSVSGISISGADAGNYTLNITASTSAGISVRHIAVTGTTDSKTYDGNFSSGAAPTITYGMLATGDTGNFSQTFDTKQAGTGKTLTPAGSVNDGNAGNNYMVTFHSVTTGTISPRTLLVTTAGVNKVYDGTTAATAILSDDRLNGDVFTDSYAAASFADKNAGLGKAITVSGISLSGPDAGDYAPNTTASATADITKRSLVVTAAGVNKVYDGTTGASVSLSDNRVAGDVLTDSYTSASFADKNAGMGKTVNVGGISISGTDAGNYSANSATTTTANISALAIIGSITAANRVYDGTTTATITNRTLSGVISGDAVSYVGGTAAFADPNAGTGKTVTAAGLSLSGPDAGNYTVNSTATATANITPALLTIQADNKAKAYGQGIPTLTATYLGLVGGDLPASLSGTLLCSTTASALSPVSGSPYSITCSGQTSINYTVTYLPGSLAVTLASSSTVVASSANPSILNAPVKFTATVSPQFSGVPTGTVAFKDGATTIGTGALDGTGHATLTTSTLALNTHSISAVYNGDGNFTGGSGSMTLMVQYASGGMCAGDAGHTILQPINFDGTSVFKQKSTVPAKFRVCDANGNSIGTPGVVSTFRLVQTTAGTLVNVVDESVDSTTPDAAFRWDPTAQQWIFNMNTKSLIADVTYYYTITLNDGSTITVKFGLK